MSAAAGTSRLQVVHLDDHAAYDELPAGRLEAAREGLRVLVAETLEEAVDLVADADADCLVAGIEGVDSASPETIAARTREAVADLPIVFFDRCDPADVLDALDAETSFVPIADELDAETYALLANRIESLAPRRREPSIFDPLAADLRTLFDDAALPICVVRDDRVTYANEPFREAFDVGSPPVRSAGVFDAVVEGEGQLRELLTPPSEGAGSIAVEYPDGDQHRIDVTAASDGGAVLALWATAAGPDADRPSREESMLRSLLAELPISIYFKDQQSRHVRVSDSLIGMSAEEYLVNGEGKRHPTAPDIVGKTDFDLYHGDHASLTVEDDRQVMETERPLGLKEEYTRSDTGQDIWLLTTKGPWYGPDGEVAGVAGVTVDVTEQKLNRREESPLDGRRDQFERVLTSTFRDELQAAIETVEGARVASSDGESREGQATAADRDSDADPDEHGSPAGTPPQEHVEEIAERLDVLQGLLADTMTLARYTRTPTQRTSIDFPAFLETVWTEVDPGTGELAVETDQVLFADEEQLHCMLRNLFEVALQYGGIGVTVTVGELEDGFYLERDGPPLAPEQRDALMEGRVDDAAESLGLAMTIVVGIADANGWDASVSSGGRRFEFTGVEMR